MSRDVRSRRVTGVTRRAQAGRSLLGLAFLLENLDAQVNALVAYVDALRASDEAAIPV